MKHICLVLLVSILQSLAFADDKAEMVCRVQKVNVPSKQESCTLYVKSTEFMQNSSGVNEGSVSQEYDLAVGDKVMKLKANGYIPHFSTPQIGHVTLSFITPEGMSIQGPVNTFQSDGVKSFESVHIENEDVNVAFYCTIRKSAPLDSSSPDCK